MDKGDDGRGIYRTIYTSLWDDPDFRDLSPNTKLVFLNLRTSPLTNLPCIYHFYLEAIEKQTGLNKKQIKSSLDTLCDTLLIEIEKGIVWVKKGLKFDPNIVLSNPKHQVAVRKVILSLPKLKIIKNFIEFYKLDIPYDIPYANQDKEKDKEKDIGYTPSHQKKNTLSDEEFLKHLKENYTWVNYDVEMKKMDTWLLTNPNRKKTRKFILNWFNRKEKPISIYDQYGGSVFTCAKCGKKMSTTQRWEKIGNESLCKECALK